MPPRDRSQDTPPPSFTPAGGGARPEASDARVVGAEDATSASRPATPRAPAPRTSAPRSSAPRPPAARPAAPRAARSTARPDASARPVPPAGATTPRPAPPVRRPADAGATPPTGSPASFAPSGRARPDGAAEPVAVPGRTGAGADHARRTPPAAPRPAAAAAAARRTTPSGSARPAPRGPAGPAGPPTAGPATGGAARGGAAPGGAVRRRRRVAAVVAVLVLACLVAWPVGLLVWAGGKLQHTPALSGAADTPGTTFLLAGSDARGGEGGIADDGTEGQRTDTILLLHVPDSGPTALISLPRDTYVDVPGHGGAKLNSAFAWGGPPLLVQTVEGLTGLTVDHYAEIGMGGVAHVVDAVGGVNLCYDGAVDDADSGMVWTPGCHDVDGTQALAFARMRKSDPQGDVGRALRQRQLISAVVGKVDPKALAVRPGAQVALVDAGTGALTFDEDAGVLDVARLAVAFRNANGPAGVTGTPPIADMDYRPGDIGSTVLLDEAAAPPFFVAVRDGTLPPGQVGGVPGA